ncbi:MAG: hypothetical protein H7A48_14570 [Akkermansiaceae bacterium]|nr:hypothetical protein [Akkermansiaceae bacterium]
MKKRAQSKARTTGKRGRPATGTLVKKVSITIPISLCERAEKYAFENNLPLSRVISEALSKNLTSEAAR